MNIQQARAPEREMIRGRGLVGWVSEGVGISRSQHLQHWCAATRSNMLMTYDHHSDTLSASSRVSLVSFIFANTFVCKWSAAWRTAHAPERTSTAARLLQSTITYKTLCDRCCSVTKVPRTSKSPNYTCARRRIRLFIRSFFIKAIKTRENRVYNSQVIIMIYYFI